MFVAYVPSNCVFHASFLLVPWQNAEVFVEVSSRLVPKMLQPSIIINNIQQYSTLQHPLETMVDVGNFHHWDHAMFFFKRG